MKKIFTKISEFIIWQVIEYVSGLLITSGILGGIALFITTWLWPIRAGYRPYIIIAVIGLGALLFSYLFKHFSKKFPHYRFLDFNFIADKKEIVFEYEDGSFGRKATYTKKYILCPLKKNLDTFKDKYFWTGDNPAVPRSKIRDQECILKNKMGVWQFYEINFPRHLTKGMPTPTEVEWKLNDGLGNAVPFISATIEQPTNLLILRLNVPHDLKITRAYGEVFANMGAINGWGSKEIPPDEKGNFVWTIEKPKLLHYYEMSWLKPI